MSSSFFSHSHDVRIQTLNMNAENLTFSAQMATSSKAFDHLYSNIAAEAVHNSDERCDAPKCHPETRTAVQEEILSWITHGDDDEQPKKIMWLTGPAGAGKTAIAGSIAETCEDTGLLAGSFFFSSFSGSEARRLKRYLITTLAYTMLQHDGLQALRGPILTAIERDPSVFRKRLRDQCKALLLKPFHALGAQLGAASLPKVIIIDGLDEVEAPDSRNLEPHEARLKNEDEQVEILSVLLQAAKDPQFPLRILIVSRPEPVLRDFFSNKADFVTKELFLDDKYDPDSDITLFLRAKFSEIRRRYRLAQSWPGDKVLETLRRSASGQFIYVATVIRFLQTSKDHPQARLDRILEPYPSSDALSPLEALYTRILKSSPDPRLAVIWIQAIKSLNFKDCPALFVRQLLQLHDGQADYLLENLASLVLIPPPGDDSSTFNFYHRSLLEFLGDERRGGRKLSDTADELVLLFATHVLRCKSPVLPLTDSEWQVFVPHFLSLFIGFFRPPEAGNAHDSLASCDVLWWVRTVDAAFCNEPELASVIIGDVFESMHHNECENYNSFASCERTCRHWRSLILAGCQALGWRVPNAIQLVRHRMWIAQAGGPGSPDEFDMGAYFEPPISDASHASKKSLPSRQEPAGLDVPDEGYDSLFELADKIHARLPGDWEERYQEELDAGKTSFNVFQSEIHSITCELGVDVRDDDMTEAWAQKFEVCHARLNQ